MPISFHCECCKQRIKAPDAAGGKWGNCPYCKHRCYIPLPKAEDEEELRLAPIDENEESKIGMLKTQTHVLTRQLLHETDLPTEPAGAAAADTPDEKTVIKTCILYLRQIADGELDGAESTLAKLKIYKRTSLRILSSMGRAERPEPELADIPDKIFQKLIQDASTSLSS
jgi:hypothetical protein